MINFDQSGLNLELFVAVKSGKLIFQFHFSCSLLNELTAFKSSEESALVNASIACIVRRFCVDVKLTSTANSVCISAMTKEGIPITVFVSGQEVLVVNVFEGDCVTSSEVKRVQALVVFADAVVICADFIIATV